MGGLMNRFVFGSAVGHGAHSARNGLNTDNA